MNVLSVCIGFVLFFIIVKNLCDMANSEQSINHFVLNCEINDFNTSFKTESAEIGGWLCNSRWEINFFPNVHGDPDTFVWCNLARLPGGPAGDINLQFKFQFFLPNDILIYETEYLTHIFALHYGRSYHRTTMDINTLLNRIRNNGFNSLIFRCLIKDESLLEPNRQYWFNLLRAT